MQKETVLQYFQCNTDSVHEAACLCSENVCMHEFRQSRAVLHIVTLQALSLLPLHLFPFPNVSCVRPSMVSFTLHLITTAAVYSYGSQSVSRACKGIRCALACSVPQGLLFSHTLFILQVTILCRWSISTSRGSSATISSRPTSLS